MNADKISHVQVLNFGSALSRYILILGRWKICLIPSEHFSFLSRAFSKHESNSFRYK
jgi:hypothetical protein